MKVPKGYIINHRFNKKISNDFNLFWTGIIIYTISYTLMTSEVVSPKVSYLQLLGLIIFTLPAIRLIRFKIENNYLRNIYFIYYCWIFFVIIRGFTLNTQYLFNTIINSESGIFLYLTPLILLFPKDLIYLKKVINAIFILSVIYIICDVVFFSAILSADIKPGQEIIEYFAKLLGFPSGFILLTIMYHKDERKFWSFIIKLWVVCVIIITLLFAILRARRGLIFMSVNILLFSYLTYNYVHKSNLFYKIFPLLIVLFLANYAFNGFNEKGSGIFSFFNERLKEDTRSDVEENYYHEMNAKDLIIGRGIDGSYYCPTGATEDGMRKNIETDYLQIMLKGGIISLGLLLFIAIPAIIKGLFKSKNTLSKAAAIWIMLWLISLYPQTVTTFSINYLLVWISIGICYSRNIRNMPEYLVREYFQYKIF